MIFLVIFIIFVSISITARCPGLCNCGCWSCCQGEKSDLESTKILTVRFVTIIAIMVVVVMLRRSRVMMVVVMLRRSRVMVVVMNLPARDSDGRVIHDAASVEVSLQNIPKQ